jgi:hypothetical protein
MAGRQPSVDPTRWVRKGVSHADGGVRFPPDRLARIEEVRLSPRQRRDRRPRQAGGYLARPRGRIHLAYPFGAPLRRQTVGGHRPERTGNLRRRRASVHGLHPRRSGHHRRPSAVRTPVGLPGRCPGAPATEADAGPWDAARASAATVQSTATTAGSAAAYADAPATDTAPLSVVHPKIPFTPAAARAAASRCAGTPLAAADPANAMGPIPARPP